MVCFDSVDQVLELVIKGFSDKFNVQFGEKERCALNECFFNIKKYIINNSEPDVEGGIQIKQAVVDKVADMVAKGFIAHGLEKNLKAGKLDISIDENGEIKYNINKENE